MYPSRWRQSNNTTMRICVVIPTLSRPNLLGQALESLAQQSYVDWDAVIVDDGSDPPVTPNQIARVIGDRYQLLRHPQPLGTAVAKNRGIASALGDLVTILDDDDLLEPRALQSIADVFAQHCEIECLFLGVAPIGCFAAEASANQGIALAKVIANAQTHREGELIFFGPALFSILLQTTPIAMQRPVARLAAWRQVGAFSPGIMCPEPGWSARAALLCRTALLATPIYRWRVDGQNHASRPAMRSAAIHSILEDRIALLQTLTRSGAVNLETLHTLSGSIATGMLDLAADSLAAGNLADAAQRLAHSLQFAISRRSVKTAMQLLLRARWHD
jgi:hypothetical protein